MVKNSLSASLLRLHFTSKKCPRDNGWGLGQRLAIDVSRNEAAEYFNWLSRKENFDACYTYLPVYNGEYAEGKTNMMMHIPVENSRSLLITIL